MGKLHYVVIASLYSLALGVISLVSFSEITIEAPEYSDKLFHLVAYILLCLLWYKAFQKNNVLVKPLLKAVLFSFIFGIIIEVLQEFVTTTRTFDFNDILANSLGIIIAVLVISFKSKIDVKKQ